MPDEKPLAVDELQFDRAVTGSSSDAGRTGVVCAVCHTAVDAEYFQINRSIVCPRCRARVEAAAETPRGLAPLLVAGLFGLGAGIAGAVIYYAVIAFAHLEIGIVAILIGYMVGYAVRKGARGRGGLRFQVLACVLTYVSVGLAYTPLALRQAAAGNRPTAALDPPGAPSGRDAGETAEPGSLSIRRRGPAGEGLFFKLPSAAPFLAAFVLLVVTLPVVVVVGSFPSGLISAIIIFIGMRQAWRMTGAPWLQILGPYRVGEGAADQTGTRQVATPA